MISRVVLGAWRSQGSSGGRAIFSESAASAVPDRSESGPYLGGLRAIAGVLPWSWRSPGGLSTQGLEMQTPQIDGGALDQDAEETTEARLVENRLDAEDLGHRLDQRPSRPPGRCAGAADDTAQKSPGDIAGMIVDGVGQLEREAFLHRPCESRPAEENRALRSIRHGPGDVGR